MIGQVDCLEVRENINHWKYKKLDLSPILYKEPASIYTGVHHMEEQDHGLTEVLDWKLLEAAKPALEYQEKVFAAFKVKNTDSTIGTIFRTKFPKNIKAKGLPDDTIHFKFTGTAGQSFGAFNTKGVTLELEGDANDYFGKGLSGARLIMYPAPGCRIMFLKKISSLEMLLFMEPLPAKHLSGVKQANVLVFVIQVQMPLWKVWVIMAVST